MKCDRRWYNDERVNLEGMELFHRASYQLHAQFGGKGTAAQPFWMWWLVSEDAARIKQQWTSLSILRIVLPEAQAQAAYRGRPG